MATSDDEASRGGRSAAADTDLGRVFALTDGVFAIAMTLLVLDLSVPEGITDVPTLTDKILEQSDNYIALGISFVVIAVFWMGHRDRFRGIREVDGPILWLNLGFLASVTLLPFTTKLLADYPDFALPTAVYALNVAIASVVMTVIYVYAERRSGRSLVAMAMESGTFDTAVVFLVSIPVAYLVSPLVGKWMWAILAFSGQLLGRVNARSRGTAGR